MTIKQLLQDLTEQPEGISFQQVIDVIEQNYQFAAVGFINGSLKNEAGTNLGSCKILAFAKLHNLTLEQTLHCFGDYYRVDVLQNPEGSDHGNIRNLIEHGLEKVSFDGIALTQK